MAITTPTGWWKYDETSGDRSPTVSSHTFVDNNTVTSGTGKINTAADFELTNSEWLSIADHADFDASASFSLSCWVNTESTIVDFRGIAGKGDFAGSFAWGLYGISGEFLRVIFPGGIFSDTPTALANSTWYHIVLVYNGGGADNAARLKIYLNGSAETLAFTGTVPATVADVAGDFTVGRFIGVGYWDGLIDEFGWWKGTALSQTEVTELYNGGSGTSYPFSIFDDGDRGMVRRMIRTQIGVPAGGVL